MTSIRASLPAVGLACIAVSVSASAEDDRQGWPTGDTWRIGAGYCQPKLDTVIQVTDATGSIGTQISFEKNLGLGDRKGTGLLFVDGRFFKRHRSATSVDSSVTSIVGDDAFDVSLPKQSCFDIAANELAYSCTILFDERTDPFLGVGLSVQSIAVVLQGTASGPVPGAMLNKQLDPTLLPPTLNVGFNYALNAEWLLQSTFGWYYQVFDVEVGESGDAWTVDYDYQGPLIGVEVNFQNAADSADAVC